MKNSPFVFGKVVSGDDFCNRVNEIKLLRNHLLNNHSVWLYSPRRYGKTSLIQKVFRETKQVQTIYFDLYNVKSVDDFSRKYADTLAKELFDWKQDIKVLGKKIIGYFKNLYPKLSMDATGSLSLSLDAVNIHKQSDIETILQLPEQWAKKNKKRICIAFDEFQEVERIEPFLVNWMRSAFQQQKHVCYVFMGSKQSMMKHIFSSTNSPFYEFGVKVSIDPISFDDLFTFISNKFRKAGLKLEKGVIEDLLHRSSCHPHFSQFFASVVYDMILEGHNPSSKNFSELWMNRVIEGQSVIFQNLYDQLALPQRNVLHAISSDELNLYTEAAKNKFKLPVSSSLSIALNGLIKKDIIYKQKSAYKFSNPVFKEWIKTINN